jgi:hypothetical protein
MNSYYVTAFLRNTDVGLGGADLHVLLVSFMLPRALIRQRHFGVFPCVLQAHQPQCASTRFRDNRLGKPDASAFRLIKSGAVQLNKDDRKAGRRHALNHRARLQRRRKSARIIL